MTPRILVAGVGNIFLGDDAFGIEVVRQLMRLPHPNNVRIADFGIRGFDLAYALLEPWNALLLIDAVPRGNPPGTLYLLEPQIPPATAPIPQFDAHSMDPVKVLQLAAALGAPPRLTRILGCEPSPLPDDIDHITDLEMSTGLSNPVRQALPKAVQQAREILSQLLTPQPTCQTSHT